MKPLSKHQRQALEAAEETLYGDIKLVEGHGRSIAALRRRGLVEGDVPHVYLTADGKTALAGILGEGV